MSGQISARLDLRVSSLTGFPHGRDTEHPSFSVDELDVDGVPVLTVHGDIDIGTAPRLCWRNR